MAVFYGIHNLPKFKNPVLTIGSFDGVHLGHQKILKEVVSAAQEIDGESILITFEPHPRKIIQPDVRLGLLSELQQKIKLIEQQGIDHIVVIAFSRDFSLLSAQEYIHQFLLKAFNPAKIVIGYDHHFGHDRSGNIHLLKEECPENVLIEEITVKLIEDAAVSSTQIRKALQSGNVDLAREMLGRPFSFDATVVHGNQLGGKIGYPTANLQVNDADIIIPGIGVYAVRMMWNNKMYDGMMSIGLRPTVVENGDVTLEVNLFDFNQDIYGENVTVYFVSYLRGEEKFDSLDQLIAQLGNDKINAQRALSQFN